MTDERLYIDGVLVDIGTDTKITLDVKSNLFRDISKIVSNNTYTVKLPKTVRNQMILEHTDLVQSDGDYPYLFHQARYFRNGVEVIKDGRATILAVTDEAIEVCIVWGLYGVRRNQACIFGAVWCLLRSDGDKKRVQRTGRGGNVET